MTTGPELFFGLVGAVGSDLKRVRELLEQEFRRVKFGYGLVRLSDLPLDCYASGRVSEAWFAVRRTLLQVVQS